jgi:hypothetical protein
MRDTIPGLQKPAHHLRAGRSPENTCFPITPSDPILRPAGAGQPILVRRTQRAGLPPTCRQRPRRLTRILRPSRPVNLCGFTGQIGKLAPSPRWSAAQAVWGDALYDQEAIHRAERTEMLAQHRGEVRAAPWPVGEDHSASGLDQAAGGDDLAEPIVIRHLFMIDRRPF